MNRAILEACLPSLLALIAGFVVLWLVLRSVRMQINVSRLWSVHRCERGSVQSLSFVLTLPLFMTILLFIVQVSQLMVGIMVVHYAAYAGARSACVWIPADVYEGEAANQFAVDPLIPQPKDDEWNIGTYSSNTPKLRKIHQAVAVALAPICPSRDFGDRRTPPEPVLNAARNTQRLYGQLAPGTRWNSKIPDRLLLKLNYAYQNTAVQVAWRETRHPDKDVETGPTYNTRGGISADPPPQVWLSYEVGWEDPVTVRVEHQFALLTGAGRWLAPYFVPGSGRTAEVSADNPHYRERIYQVKIAASATMTNEGLKSVVRHAQTLP